jgi:hypothetical protein
MQVGFGRSKDRGGSFRIAPFIRTNCILGDLLGVVVLGQSVTKRKLPGIAMAALCVLLLAAVRCFFVASDIV